MDRMLQEIFKIRLALEGINKNLTIMNKNHIFDRQMDLCSVKEGYISEKKEGEEDSEIREE
jgi:hypothetical protein